MKYSDKIGFVLRTGLWLSVLIVLFGGIFYLIQHGNQSIPYRIFPDNLQAFAKKGIWASFSFTAEGIIQLGLLILIITQILRVILITCMFTEEKDYPFIAISLGILLVLIYSVFLRN